MNYILEVSETCRKDFIMWKESFLYEFEAISSNSIKNIFWADKTDDTTALFKKNCILK